jgi:acetoin utilization protein AcuB
MFVEDYMTAPPETVAGDASLAEARRRMDTRHVRHLPVVDEGRRLVGILSDRDVRAAAGYDQARAARLSVAEVMIAEPVTINAAATLDEALAVFHTRRIGALPVVRGRELVGILTRSDVLRAFYEVLGLDEAGRTVEIALPNGSIDIAAAFSALVNADHQVISAVVSRMRRDSGEPSLYVRVRGDATRKVERLLRDAALIVLEPELR